MVNKIKTKAAQFKIQQMAFMLVAVFFFFVLVGLAFLGFESKNIKSDSENAQIRETISSLKVIADMTELNCKSTEYMCLDEDKLLIMASRDETEIWPVSSVEVRKIYPSPLDGREIRCPAENCNYYPVFLGEQNENIKKYSTFVSICKKLKEAGQEFSIERIFKNANKIYRNWNGEIGGLTNEPIEYKTAITAIAKHFKYKQKKAKKK